MVKPIGRKGWKVLLFFDNAIWRWYIWLCNVKLKFLTRAGWGWGMGRGGGGGGGQKGPLPKTYYTYPTIMKLGTVIPYLKKIQKIYESRVTHFEFCWYHNFFTRNQLFSIKSNFAISRNAEIDCILVHNFYFF